MANSKLALITGASGGIGKELAKIHAKQGGNLIIIARSTNKLKVLQRELQDEYGVQVMVISKELMAFQKMSDFTSTLTPISNTIRPEIVPGIS